MMIYLSNLLTIDDDDDDDDDDDNDNFDAIKTMRLLCTL
jgi:hypothetical protein